MRYLLALGAAALAAGCASDPNVQYAKAADCKVVPVTIASATGSRPKNLTSLDQRKAEMDLASSPYRQAQLASRGQFGNNVEEALSDCNRR